MGEDLGEGRGKRYVTDLYGMQTIQEAYGPTAELIDSPVISVAAETSVEEACEVGLAADFFRLAICR